MKKKPLLMAAVLLLAANASLFSLGIGAAFGINRAGTKNVGNVMISVKFDQTPITWGITYNLKDPFALGLYADYIMVRQPLVNFVNIYAGPGLFFGYADTANDSIALGLRVPVALYIFPLDFLEIFLELAPAFSFIPSPDLMFQSAFGFRFWF